MLTKTQKPAANVSGAAVDPERAKVLAQAIRMILFGLTALVGVAFLALPLVFSKAVFFSPQWFYGLFIVVLSALGAFLDHAGRRVLAVALIYALLFDISLAIGSKVGSALQLTANFMPEHKRPLLKETGFRFHPLLQIMLTPGYSQGGYDHTAQSTRAVVDPAASPGPRQNVALVGGSSTYDIDLTQGDTWPDRLQERFPQYRFWNFGCLLYTSDAADE